MCLLVCVHEQIAGVAAANNSLSLIDSTTPDNFIFIQAKFLMSIKYILILMLNTSHKITNHTTIYRIFGFSSPSAVITKSIYMRVIL
jgi:hypothetical protein